jgi:hypothetical protein
MNFDFIFPGLSPGATNILLLQSNKLILKVYMFHREYQYKSATQRKLNSYSKPWYIKIFSIYVFEF